MTRNQWDSLRLKTIESLHKVYPDTAFPVDGDRHEVQFEPEEIKRGNHG